MTLCALEVNVTTVPVHDVSDDGQADACPFDAFRFRTRAAYKLSKDLFLLRRWNAKAGVPHIDDQAAVQARHIHPHVGGIGRILDGVIEEIPEGIRQRFAIADDQAPSFSRRRWMW